MSLDIIKFRVVPSYSLSFHFVPVCGRVIVKNLVSEKVVELFRRGWVNACLGLGGIGRDGEGLEFKGVLYRTEITLPLYYFFVI